ncbi:endonuclease domain-containing protein [Nakamurella flava]|uniref:endonuclease domain-containing protein n=1 Tax=Nakamurella flava TaxID=2576308 RepID=UPI0014097E83|nr:DUF559 domain-containing protein [Nakamurella flava]
MPIRQDLQASAFTVAQGRAAGLTRFELEHPHLQRPFRGVRFVRDESADTFRARCLAALASVSATGNGDAVLSHLSAAHWWPVPIPTPLDGGPVDVAVRLPGRASRATGIRGHVLHDPRARVVMRQGMPMVDAGTLFCQLSAVLLVPDLVAVGDAMALTPAVRSWDDDRPWLTVEELADRVHGFRGRGKRRAVAALTLLRPGAESRPETLLRLRLGDASLPEPEVNGVVRDGVGRFVARCDLLDRQWRVVVEYDGDQHRTSRAQFEKDVRRLEELAALGWRVVRVLSRDLFVTPDLTVLRVATALRQGGWPPGSHREDACAAR